MFFTEQTGMPLRSNVARQIKESASRRSHCEEQCALIGPGARYGSHSHCDDHDSLRRGLARALTDAGHDVEEASNGNVAMNGFTKAPSTSC